MIKKHRFVKRNRRKNGKFIKNNQKTVILVFIFIIGVFSGAFSVKNADAQLLVKIKELTESYIALKSSGSILNNFISATITDFIFISISSVFGLCLLGAPVLWALPAFRGLGLGVLLGYIYSSYGVNGLAYSIVSICIPTAFSACAMIVSCKEGILSVRDLQSAFSEQKEFNAKQYYKLYFLRNIILFAIMLFAAAVGSVLSMIPSVSLPS